MICIYGPKLIFFLNLFIKILKYLVMNKNKIYLLICKLLAQITIFILNNIHKNLDPTNFHLNHNLAL